MAAAAEVNVYDFARPGTTVRQSDGLFQKEFVYQGAMFDPQRHENPVGTSRGSALVLDPCATASLGSFRLPDTARGRPAAAEEAGDVTKVVMPAGHQDVWGMELFMKASEKGWDGECRWGLVLLYDASSGAVSKITLTQEYDTCVDPATPHVLSACADAGRQPWPPLPADSPAGWVSHGSVGRCVARVRAAPPAPAPGAEGGSGAGGAGAEAQLLLEEGLNEPVRWEPPIGAARHGQDGSPAASAAAGAPGLGLQRLVVRYDAASGEFLDACREVFGPAD
ncbi:hypothetical protein GPECTOR_5g48 [Gonium pectorale]|uniref:Uncharacterized protein n=1 Tax=Gonium pectorale TaxID=33097 RepID=A0A150GX01_GONPE|nr:hypothetical protein GPECTOR_5g48 [Gonium pectorale]|eukprot:KXZ54391.1 hypothetical protein GPECTOR_5g48 [Gonium pectorale]